MLRKSFLRLYQAGAHVPHGAKYRGARMKNWPEQKLPRNFEFTKEQRLKVLPFPRDTGHIPRDFVLTVLYRSQPCEVDKLWDLCSAECGCPLDSKRHLREVLKQARDESWICFEKETSTSDNWLCLLTRERFEEVRDIVAAMIEREKSAVSSTMRSSAISETEENAQGYAALSAEQKLKYLEQLAKETEAANEKLLKYQRIEVDYLPFTDLNGKVDFMWWYESKDNPRKDPVPLPNSSTSAVPVSAGSADDGGSRRQLE